MPAPRTTPVDRPPVRLLPGPDRGGGSGPRAPRRPAGLPATIEDDAGRLRRRALTLLGVTLVAPGSAQVVTAAARPGRFALAGRIVLRAWLAGLGLVLLLGLAWLVHREFVLGLLTHQSVLRGGALLLFGLALAWPALVLDAWRLGASARLPVGTRRRLALLSAGLVAVTCLLPLAAGRRVWAGADLLSGVFSAQASSAAVDGRYNVLLLGGDAGPDRIGTRPDSVTLASIDARSGRTVLFSLPRNLQNVPFPAGTPAARALPNGWNCGDTCLLNAVYQWGGEHPQYFPGARDPGAAAMKQAVQAVTGLSVNYYVLIDLRGFRAMIDAVGGIDVDVTSRVPIGGETSPISGWIEPGRQHLNGFHALWYARSRTTTSDYDRMARQRCVMTAMVNQLDPGTLLGRFQAIAAAGKQVVSTDIPAGDLPQFITLGQQAKRRKIQSVQFVPPLIVPRHPDFAVIRAKVAAAVDDNRAGSDAVVAAPAPGPASASASARSSGPTPVASGAPSSVVPATDAGKPVDVRSVCAAD